MVSEIFAANSLILCWLSQPLQNCASCRAIVAETCACTVWVRVLRKPQTTCDNIYRSGFAQYISYALLNQAQNPRLKQATNYGILGLCESTVYTASYVSYGTFKPRVIFLVQMALLDLHGYLSVRESWLYFVPNKSESIKSSPSCSKDV